MIRKPLDSPQPKVGSVWRVKLANTPSKRGVNQELERDLSRFK
ncbi:MAG: hypothetical protein AAFU85_25060 [Planctomycetota bacterium]